MYLPSVSGCVPGITRVPTLSRWMCSRHNQCTYHQSVDVSLAKPVYLLSQWKCPWHSQHCVPTLSQWMCPWHHQSTYPQLVDTSLARPAYIPPWHNQCTYPQSVDAPLEEQEERGVGKDRLLLADYRFCFLRSCNRYAYNYLHACTSACTHTPQAHYQIL